MKLLIIAALVAVCSAASLEKLEQKSSQDLQPEAPKPEEPKPEESQVQEVQEEPKAEEEEKDVQKKLKEYLPPTKKASGSLNQYLPPRKDSNGAAIKSRFGQTNQPTAPVEEKDPFANIPQQAFDEKTGYIY